MSITIKDFNVSEFTLVEVEEQDEAEVIAENAGKVVIVEGKPGKDGEPGKDGYTPIKGIDYFDGKNGEPGKDGENATPEQIAEAVEDYFEENPVSGGDEVFVVNIQNDNGNHTADKTYEEIIAAEEAGKKIVAYLNGNKNMEYEYFYDGLFSYILGQPFNSTISFMALECKFKPDGTIEAGGALKNLPIKTSQLENDSGFITLEDIPEVEGKVTAESIKEALGYVPADEEDIPKKPEDVGAEKAGAVAEHNVDPDSHNDIRVSLAELKSALEAFLDIDEPTLDQLSELIAKIQANAGSVEQLTNGKVNVADIVNNLTTNVANKPLSAAQGVVLKGLIDAIKVPTKTSQLTNDSGYITANDIPEGGVTSWNDLEDRPFYLEELIEPIVILDSFYNLETNEWYNSPINLGPLVGQDEILFYKGNVQVSAVENYINATAKTIGVETSNVLVQINDVPLPEGAMFFDALFDGYHIEILVVSKENAYGVPIGVYVCEFNIEWWINSGKSKGVISNEEIVPLPKKYLPEDVVNGAKENVKISDIVDNLFIIDPQKVLSATQGNVIKGLIDNLDADVTEAKTNATNASNKVDDLEERMDSGEFKGEDGKDGLSVFLATGNGSSAATPYDREFALSSVTTNGRNVQVGDFILSPSTTLYVVGSISGNVAYCNLIEELKGKDGTSVTVSNVSESTASGGTNTVTFSDGKKVNIKNGINGTNGTNGKDYVLTEADKTEIAQMVISEIGTPIAGMVDEENNIILGGDLANGTYAVKYISNGEYVEIGTLNLSSEEPAPDTTIVWNKGLKIDSGSGAETENSTTYSASNFIKVVEGYTYTINKITTRQEGIKVCYYSADNSEAFISTSADIIAQTANQTSVVIPIISGVAYFRLRLFGTASQLNDTGDYTLTATKA